MTNETARVEIITGPKRRRRYSAGRKLAMAKETMHACTVSCRAAFTWRQLMSQDSRAEAKADEDVVAASRVHDLE
jgi:transposase